jgi:hypothetical protein
MSIYISKATKNQLEQLHNEAINEKLFIEMRDKNGILLAVSNGLKSLTEEKDKNGKPLYRVETKKILDYDHVKEVILYDIQLDFYKGKKEIHYSNPRVQQFFDKQEQFWFERVEKFIKNPWIFIGSDIIVNRVK